MKNPIIYWNKYNFITVTLGIICIGASFGQKVYNEANGIVIMEAENTPSPLGAWVKTTAPANFTGTGGIEMSGNTPNGGNANSPLKYQFKITKAGIYKLALRAHKRLEGQPNDKCNDSYIKVEGDYTSGSTTLLSFLTTDEKMFIHGQSATMWDWTSLVEGGRPLYNFKSGQTYTFTLSGRAQRFNVDRIAFFIEADSVLARDSTTPESSTGPVGINKTKLGKAIFNSRAENEKIYSLSGQNLRGAHIKKVGKIISNK